jgi:hypothetical protein
MNKYMVFDHECKEGHRNEYFVKVSQVSVPCIECGLVADRVLNAPNIKLEGISGAFPTASDAWARKHEEAVRKARQRKES